MTPTIPPGSLSVKYERILSMCDCGTKSGIYTQIRCPNEGAHKHNDKAKSASLGLHPDGISFKCFAGCQTSDFLEVLGLTYRDLYPDSARAPDKVFTYYNKDGTFHHDKVKFNRVTPDAKNEYYQRTIDDKGNLIKTAQQGIPYAYPFLVEAIKAGRDILYCEGEKDVDTARLLGYEATTMGGASDWKASYAQFFKDARLVLIPDKDAPGLRVDGQIVNSVKGVAKSLKVVVLPVGKDLTEFIEAGHTNRDIDALIAAATEQITTKSEVKPEETKLICLDDVEEKPLEWLVEPYIPMGKVTMLEGDPGLGKSQITDAWTAAATRGDSLLPGTPKIVAGNVLLLGGEDALDDTVKPRLRILGADMKRVFATETDWALDDHGLMVLEAQIRLCRPILVIIDPLSAGLGLNIDMNKANHARHVMKQVGAIAERNHCAVVVVRHVTKTKGASAKMAGIGSVDFTGAVRSQILVIWNEDTNEHAIQHTKINVAEKGKTIGYEIVQEGGYSRIRWTGETDMTYSDSVSTEEKQNALEEVKAWLESYLMERTEAPSGDIDNECTKRGYSFATLKRAKRALGVISYKPPGMKIWYCKLPEVVQPAKGDFDVGD